MKRVSIVIPTYNSELFIQDTLDSVASQTHEKIDIIVVDDGSTDATLDIVGAHPGNITTLTQKNCGRGAARNVGVKHATGPYIAFLDHDDLLLPTSVADRVGYLDSHPTKGWVFSDAIEFDENGDLQLFLKKFPWLDLSLCNFTQLLVGCYPLMSTVMIRSDLLRDVGGVNAAINYGDDLELFMRLMLVSEVGMIDIPLTRRRLHLGQGVSSTFDRWASRVKIYETFNPTRGSMTTSQRQALRVALKHAYFKLAECYWEENDFTMAQRFFSKSLEFTSRKAKTLCYWLLCNTPNTVKRLRKIKGRLAF